MQHEGQLTSKLLKELRNLGCLCLKVHGHGMQASGYPDALIMHKKFFCFCEFKVIGNKLTPLQERMIELITQHGVRVFIIVFEEKQCAVYNHEQKLIKRCSTTEDVMSCLLEK